MRFLVTALLIVVSALAVSTVAKSERVRRSPNYKWSPNYPVPGSPGTPGNPGSPGTGLPYNLTCSSLVDVLIYFLSNILGVPGFPKAGLRDLLRTLLARSRTPNGLVGGLLG